MGETFRDFLNHCATEYGKVIEANYYGNNFATIKVETRDNQILELSIKLEDKKETDDETSK